MPVIFQPPVKTYRAPHDNPAECLATTGDLEFGLTIPEYNGIDIRELQAHDVEDPRVQTDSNQIVVQGRAFNASARVTLVPTHRLSWPMLLPPQPIDGVWTSTTKISGRDLPKKLEIVSKSCSEVGKPIPPQFDIFSSEGSRLVNARTDYTLHVRPMPGVDEFMNHIEFHECQHVADHRWLAERIIGWWDDWLQELQAGQIDIVTTHGVTDLSVSTGFGYAVGVWRIIDYWCKAAAQSGQLFHTTPAGQQPRLNISEITDDSITVTVTPRELLYEKPDLLKVSPHREMSFAIRNLDGNERKLTHATAAPNPFHEFQWDKLDAQHWARRE